MMTAIPNHNPNRNRNAVSDVDYDYDQDHDYESSSRRLVGPSSAPGWTWRAVILSAVVTLALYVMIPFLGSLSVPPESDLELRKVDTIAPPPPMPDPPTVVEPAPQNPSIPRPQLEVPRPPLAPLAVPLNLEIALGNFQGDFAVDFRVRPDDLMQPQGPLVFELGALDEPPRPLSRLAPVYPPQARMRRQEGFVVLEFLVSPSGEVREVQVMDAEPGELFVDAAMRSVRHWKFQPGTKDGQAVTARVRQRLSFTLQ